MPLVAGDASAKRLQRKIVCFVAKGCRLTMLTSPSAPFTPIFNTFGWNLRVMRRSSDRILAALGVGRQAEQYKRVKAILDQLIPKI